MSAATAAGGGGGGGAVSPLRLYRQLLRAVQYYPSVRRGAIYDAVREEFRREKHASPEAAHEKLRLGVMELQRLRVWRGTRAPEDPSKPNPARDWEVRL